MNKKYSKGDALFDLMLLIITLIIILPASILLWIWGKIINKLKGFNEWMQK